MMLRYIKQSFKLTFLTVVFICGLALVNTANASGQAELVREEVEKNVLEVLALFNDEREFYESDPDRFFRNMDAALNKIVDFRRIAARVMGKYGRKASKDQKNRFVEVFKQSLYKTYTKTLIDTGVFNIKVTKAKLNSRSDKKATVDLEVISDNGTVFPVIYSMHKNKQGVWLLENVIVFGVNVGLAFRDRFELQVRKSKGNIDKVIDTWTVDLELKQPEEKKS